MAISRRACWWCRNAIRPSRRRSALSPGWRCTARSAISCPARGSRPALTAPISPAAASRSSGPMTCWPMVASSSGMLLEAQKRPDGGMAIVIGIGVNVVAAPDGLPYPATPRCAQLGIEADAARCSARCPDAWVDAYEAWDQGRGDRRDPRAVARRCRRHRRRGCGRAATATSCAEFSKRLNEAGRLIVRANDNSRIAITAGDVHFGTTASQQEHLMARAFTGRTRIRASRWRRRDRHEHGGLWLRAGECPQVDRGRLRRDLRRAEQSRVSS